MYLSPLFSEIIRSLDNLVIVVGSGSPVIPIDHHRPFFFPEVEE